MKRISVFLFAVGLMLLPANVLAIGYDLTSLGSTTKLNDGALAYQADPQATGSGVIDSFVRISANTDVVQGYNTSGRPVQYDENTSPTFTHGLLLNNVPTTLIGGILYREFLLDINQISSPPSNLESLDAIDIYQSNTASITDDTLFSTPIWSLDDSILLDYNLNAGSGSGDMFLYVPDALFNASTYVYLYSMFGSENANNDGYEEWAVREGTGSTPAPESATMLLMGTALVGLARLSRKKIKK